MTTFESRMLELLEQHGMFDTQARAVIDIAKTDPALDAMTGRWSDDPGGYPEIMVNICWVSVKSVAAKWIDENAPLAWFRPMFEASA